MRNPKKICPHCVLLSALTYALSPTPLEHTHHTPHTTHHTPSIIHLLYRYIESINLVVCGDKINHINKLKTCLQRAQSKQATVAARAKLDRETALLVCMMILRGWCLELNTLYSCSHILYRVCTRKPWSSFIYFLLSSILITLALHNAYHRTK